MNSRRGQASTFSLEQFVRIAVSVTIAAFLLIIIIALVSFFMSPSKQDASATNVFDEFINVIEAQEGDVWETKTIIVFYNLQYNIIGFSQDSPSTRHHVSGEQTPFERPSSCEGTCFCLYQGANTPQEKLIGCETIDFSNIVGHQFLGEQASYDGFVVWGELTAGHVPNCRLYDLRKEQGTLHIGLSDACRVAVEEVTDEACNSETHCCRTHTGSEECLHQPHDYTINDGPNSRDVCRHVAGGSCEIRTEGR